MPAPSRNLATNLLTERRQLEEKLRRSPSDSGTRQRLLEIAQLLGDKPEILRHQAILKAEANPLYWWGKLALLAILLVLILQQICGLLRQLSWWSCPYDRSSP